ncbi:MAG: FAD-dependent oxidoreductase [Archaeoglobus sp.]|nr:FAD-dependent oxidoreductase [Archaeoglobus sp.]
MRIAIIGGGAAGMSAASRIKRLRPEWDVKVFERASYVSHAPCGVPFYVSGFVRELSQLCAYNIDFFREDRGIDVHPRSEVREVGDGYLEVIEDGRKMVYEWDKLLFSTGARATPLNVSCEDLEGVLCVHYIENGEKVKQMAAKSDRVVVVGSGYIGIEMSEALSSIGKKVTLIEKERNPLPDFDEEIGVILKKRLEEKVEAKFDENVVSVEGKERVRKVVTDKAEYDCDLVIVAVGEQPNVELAKELGVKLGKSGAIETNSRMETNVANAYAAGDCAETINIVTGEKDWIPLAAPANKMGYVAGVNMAGREMEFPGAVRSQLTSFYELEIGKTGLSEKEAKAKGFKPISATITTKSTARYLPNGDITVKLVADESGKVLGVQAVGAGVGKRIYAAASLLYKKSRVEDFFFVDLPYYPPESRVWDPLIVAARNLFRKLGIP